jgi:pimeloyl-ACP methyl ester carboxylesterase
MSSAETWVLIRGLSREAAHWGRFLPIFRAALPDVNVVTVDLPGVGQRLAEPWPRTIGEAMESTRALVPSGGRTFVLGVSLGGMVTMEWAGRHPGELAGIVVGASSAGNVAPFWKRFSPGILPRIAVAGLRGVAAREAAVVRTIINREDLWEETTALCREIQAARPVPTAVVRGQILSGARWKVAERLDVPALFLVGQGDRLTHPDCSRALAKRFGAPLSVHPTAGHDLTTDAGEWVAEELVRWRAQR